jgi:hypothetical protein
METIKLSKLQDTIKTEQQRRRKAEAEAGALTREISRAKEANEVRANTTKHRQQ